jgi:hypothetical protein
MTWKTFYTEDPHVLGAPYKMSRFVHPCLTFPITQRSTLPPANSYKDGRPQPTNIHTSKLPLSLRSVCRTSHYAPSFFFRFNPGCGQDYDGSSDQITVIYSRGVLILFDKHCLSLVARILPRACSVGWVGHVTKISEPTGSDKRYLLDKNKHPLWYTLNRTRHNPLYEAWTDGAPLTL